MRSLWTWDWPTICKGTLNDHTGGAKVTPLSMSEVARNVAIKDLLPGELVRAAKQGAKDPFTWKNIHLNDYEHDYGRGEVTFWSVHFILCFYEDTFGEFFKKFHTKISLFVPPDEVAHWVDVIMSLPSPNLLKFFAYTPVRYFEIYGL